MFRHPACSNQSYFNATISSLQKFCLTSLFCSGLLRWYFLSLCVLVQAILASWKSSLNRGSGITPSRIILQKLSIIFLQPSHTWHRISSKHISRYWLQSEVSQPLLASLCSPWRWWSLPGPWFGWGSGYSYRHLALMIATVFMLFNVFLWPNKTNPLLPSPLGLQLGREEAR